MTKVKITLGMLTLLATLMPANVVRATVLSPSEQIKLVTVDNPIPRQTETTLSQDKQVETQISRRRRQRRRCRWVPGHGLVCDGGQFGTITL